MFNQRCASVSLERDDHLIVTYLWLCVDTVFACNEVAHRLSELNMGHLRDLAVV